MFYILYLLSGFFIHPASNTYYVKAGGNDSAAGTSDEQAWASISKVNSAALSPGDMVLFNKGDTFNGALVVQSSGITYSGYGRGKDPVIDGFTRVTGWSAYGKNIYRASVPNRDTRINLLALNGVNRPMGRLPKQTPDFGGYAPVERHAADSITSNFLAGKNFAGGEVVARKGHDYIYRAVITRHSGTTITFADPENFWGSGNGFFVQNHLSCLTGQGDWYFDQSSGYLYIYLKGNPAKQDIRITTVANLVTVTSKSNITIDGLSFQGANTNAIAVDGAYMATRFQLLNSTIKYSGVNAVHLVNISGCVIQNNTIRFTNNNAIDNFYSMTNSLVKGNRIDSTGMWPGMGANGFATHLGIGCSLASGTRLIGNQVTNTGYAGLYLFGGDMYVGQNFVKGSCFIKDDGGGIYFGTRQNDADFDKYPANTIEQNIVVNGPGNSQGLNDGQTWASGIYLDDRNNNFIVRNNTVSNFSLNGIFIHASFNIQILNNTVYNCGAQVTFEANGRTYPNTIINRIVLKNNTLVATLPVQKIIKARSEYPDNRGRMGVFDSNYYYQASSTAAAFYTSRKETGGANRLGTDVAASDYHLSFTQWKGLNNSYDIHTTNQSSITPNSTRLEYNQTESAKEVSLKGAYKTLAGKSYTGKISLPPYSSIVLQRITKSAMR